MAKALARDDYKRSGLLPSPPVRRLAAAEANEMLARWHYLGPVRGIKYAFGHDEGCCVFTNCRSRIYERRYPGTIELARMVGAPGHKWAISSLMSRACREIKRLGYKRIVTYADPYAGHDGMVYRAAGWAYDGESAKDGHPLFFIDDVLVSPRTLYDRHGTQSVAVIRAIYGDRLRIEPKPAKRRFVKEL